MRERERGEEGVICMRREKRGGGRLEEEEEEKEGVVRQGEGGREAQREGQKL